METEPVRITIRDLDDGDIQRFWTYFTKTSKGADKLGHVKRADIAAAFKACIPDRSKLLFWSAGTLQTFRTGAIQPYARKHGLSLVADVSSSEACKRQGLAGIERKSLRAQIKEWKQKEEEDKYHKKAPKDAKKRYTYTYNWAMDALENANLAVGRSHYWPVMSEGFADAATGEVYYLRPDRKGNEPEDYSPGIWGKYELPALKSNRDVVKVIEVTMPQDTTLATNPESITSPGRIRHQRS